MPRILFCALLSLIAWLAAADPVPIAQQHWFEARTAHFNIYSCGSTQDVARVGGRLEQFRDAYSLLAGAQAVASPPIVVMAFPTHEALEPFLPLYQGKPANLAAFFHRGSDENLIALCLPGAARNLSTASFTNTRTCSCAITISSGRFGLPKEWRMSIQRLKQWVDTPSASGSRRSNTCDCSKNNR
jgi:hypothetical protein